MRAAGQPANVPGEFLERVTLWAQGQPDPVSVILFGSRARGDHGLESDWDFALVYEGTPPSLDGLPSSIEDREIDWAPMKRSRAMELLNVCGIQHAVATDGRCLHGVPLPRPERHDVNIPDAWDLLLQARNRIRLAMTAMADYWELPQAVRGGREPTVAVDSAMAGELLCKAALSMRGVEPRRSHSVRALCDDLERRFPDDPLLPMLRRCDGLTSEAHVSVYSGLASQRETIGVSARRLASVLRAFGEVLAAACNASFADEGRDWMENLGAREGRLREEVRRLCSSACPPDILRRVQSGLDAGPDSSELWERLLADPQGRARERAGRGGDSQQPLGPCPPDSRLVGPPGRRLRLGPLLERASRGRGCGYCMVRNCARRLRP